MIVWRRRSAILPTCLLLVSTLSTATLHGQVTGQDLDDDSRRAERKRRQQESEGSFRRIVIERLADRAEEAIDFLTQLEQSIEDLDSRMRSLLTDDDGKRLAADGHASMGFVRLFELPLPTVGDVRSRKESTKALLNGLRRELEMDNVGYIPPEDVSNEIIAQFYWAQDRLARIREERGWLEAAIKRAPSNIDLKSARTLKQATDMFMVNRVDTWLIGVLQGIEDASDESKEIVRDKARLIEVERALAESERMWRAALAQIEQMKIEDEVRVKRETAAERERLTLATIAYENKLAELRRKEEDAEAQRKADELKAQLERDKTLDDAKKPMLVKRCQDPETRTILAPFLDKGMVRPSGNRGTRYYDTIEPVPVSLKDLYACGALDQTPEGLDKLYWATIDPQDTMRTRWRRSQQWRTTPALREKLVNAQKLLIELGPTLVELEMLQE